MTQVTDSNEIIKTVSISVFSMRHFTNLTNRFQINIRCNFMKDSVTTLNAQLWDNLYRPTSRQPWLPHPKISSIDMLTTCSFANTLCGIGTRIHATTHCKLVLCVFRYPHDFAEQTPHTASTTVTLLMIKQSIFFKDHLAMKHRLREKPFMLCVQFPINMEMSHIIIKGW